MVDLKQYFHNKYQGGESFVNNVILPIFGEDKYEDAFEEDVLEDNPELSTMAANTGISSLLRIGTINLPMNPTDVFDITVTNQVQMKHNRVTVQHLVRRIMSTYSSAFMIFHYKDNDCWDWRFTFCSKQGKNSEATDSKRYTFLLGPNQTCRTAADNFKKLASKNGNIELDDIVKAFDVEALSDEFFAKYKQHYERFVEYVTGKRFVKVGGKWEEKTMHEPHPQMYADFGSNDKRVRDYVKKLLGRIVFLHFLQKKGWMGVPEGRQWGEGDPQFMLHLFECATQEQKDDFLDSVLEPLFAQGLDTDRTGADDIFDTHVALENGSRVKVPYLNGGLFERDALDEITTKFPADYFRDLLDFFYQYNFTIDENDPDDAQVGVDPEILGRIFENLLEDNKDKGAYYTPKEIVRYMCRQSLTAYLNTGINDEAQRKAIEEFVRTYDVAHLGGADTRLAQMLDRRLKEVKICDPAIGSGAFPMGLLKELFLCRGAIERFDNAAEIKRHIIQQNIYGVDIERGAVDIARLRFWLSLVVDEETPHTLPNLDFKIMQGNSLLENYEGFDLSILVNNKNDVTIVQPQADMFGNIDDSQLSFTFSKASTSEELQKNIQLYFCENEHTEKTNIRKRIEDCLREQLFFNIDRHIGHADRIINEVSAQSKTSSKQQKALSEALKEKEAYEKIMEEAKTMPFVNDKFFLWHTWFNDVFNRPSGRDGFDIVIGNPPYIEAKKLKYIASTLKKYFSVYSGTADFSIYFLELGMRLLRDNGILSYITTNKFFNTGYGKPVRKLIAKSDINILVNFEQVEVFKDILVSSVILNVRKSDARPHKEFVYERFYKLNADDFRREFVQRIGNMGTYPQDFLDEKEWSFADISGLRLKSKIEYGATPLGDVESISINRGVTTGYNPAFIISNEQKESLVAQDARNAEVIKNMLQGRNIRKWYYNESDENLIFTRKGCAIDNYPFIKEHLQGFYNNLKPKKVSTDENGRKPGNYKWYEILDNTAYYPEFEKPEKIIWGLTANNWAFAYDDKQHYLPSNGYILTSTEIPIKYLLGWLNSKLMHHYFSYIGVMTAGGAYTLKAATISALPFKMPNDFNPVIEIVDSILQAKSENVNADTSKQEHAIDLFVYDLYGLTENEIAIVEGSLLNNSGTKNS